jgi:hypothetical protein
VVVAIDSAGRKPFLYLSNLSFSEANIALDIVSFALTQLRTGWQIHLTLPANKKIGY